MQGTSIGQHVTAWTQQRILHARTRTHTHTPGTASRTIARLRQHMPTRRCHDHGIRRTHQHRCCLSGGSGHPAARGRGLSAPSSPPLLLLPPPLVRAAAHARLPLRRPAAVVGPAAAAGGPGQPPCLQLGAVPWGRLQPWRPLLPRGPGGQRGRQRRHPPACAGARALPPHPRWPSLPQQPRLPVPLPAPAEPLVSAPPHPPAAGPSAALCCPPPHCPSHLLPPPLPPHPWPAAQHATEPRPLPAAAQTGADHSPPPPPRSLGPPAQLRQPLLPSWGVAALQGQPLRQLLAAGPRAAAACLALLPPRLPHAPGAPRASALQRQPASSPGAATAHFPLALPLHPASCCPLPHCFPPQLRPLLQPTPRAPVGLHVTAPQPHPVSWVAALPRPPPHHPHCSPLLLLLPQQQPRSVPAGWHETALPRPPPAVQAEGPRSPRHPPPLPGSIPPPGLLLQLPLLPRGPGGQRATAQRHPPAGGPLGHRWWRPPHRQPAPLPCLQRCRPPRCLGTPHTAVGGDEPHTAVRKAAHVSPATM